MKVYIDITQTLAQESVTGIQRTVIERIKHLNNNGVELVLLNHNENLKADLGFYVCSLENFLNFYVKKTLKDKGKIVTQKTILVDDIIYGDVFLDLDLPFGSYNRLQTYKILSENGVSVVPIVHDIIPLIFPQNYDQNLLEYFSEFIKAMALYSDYIITHTENTKNDIQQFINENNLPSKRIEINTLGSDYTIEKNDDQEVSEKIEQILNSNKYLLSVGTIEPRKNHIYSLNAFDNGLFDENINYVIVGKKGWKVDELYEKLLNHPKYNESLFILENVSDYELDQLYKNAYFTLFPTEYEGFGLPLVESYQRGVPVLTSNIPIMREVGKQAADYFELDDVTSLVDLVKMYLSNEEKYEELKRNVLEYHVVTWEESTQVMIDLICGSKKEPRLEIPYFLNCDEIINNIEHRANSIRKNKISTCIGENEPISHNIHVNSCDASFNDMNKYLFEANTNYYVTSYYPFKTNRKFGKIVIFGKKVLRKLNRAIVEIPLEKQTRFNKNVVRYLNETNKLYNAIDENLLNGKTDARINELHEIKKATDVKITELEEVNKSRELKITELEEVNKARELKLTELASKIELLEMAFNQNRDISNEKYELLKSREEDFVKRAEFERATRNIKSDSEFAFASYSQAGEDMILKYIFREGFKMQEKDVIYLDIGANNPVSLSNTYLFYSEGASGVLVEPNKELVYLLEKERPRDTILSLCVDLEDEKTTVLYKANFDGGLSTINEQVKDHVLTENENITFEVDSYVKTITVNSIIENILKCVPDFISIDVEGNEMRVLNSIDFTKYRPKVFVIEMIPYSVKITGNEKNVEILEFMKDKGYKEYCFNGINSIFIDEKY